MDPEPNGRRRPAAFTATAGPNPAANPTGPVISGAQRHQPRGTGLPVDAGAAAARPQAISTATASRIVVQNVTRRVTMGAHGTNPSQWRVGWTPGAAWQVKAPDYTVTAVRKSMADATRRRLHLGAQRHQPRGTGSGRGRQARMAARDGGDSTARQDDTGCERQPAMTIWADERDDIAERPAVGAGGDWTVVIGRERCVRGSRHSVGTCRLALPHNPSSA